MGMPFRHPVQGYRQGTVEKGIDWLGSSNSETVSITLNAHRLRDLLRNHQLYVQEFSCVDESSKVCVHRLLLAMLSRTG
ncbi:MAG: hypothetical protein WD623_00020 [Marinobacter sp.]|uniref:hypothetical protein n=1 Tax=Marinobacter sp. TaxID=50741 RepID=UPI00349FEFBB